MHMERKWMALCESSILTVRTMEFMSLKIKVHSSFFALEVNVNGPSAPPRASLFRVQPTEQTLTSFSFQKFFLQNTFCHRVCLRTCWRIHFVDTYIPGNVSLHWLRVYCHCWKQYYACIRGLSSLKKNIFPIFSTFPCLLRNSCPMNTTTECCHPE